MNATHSFFTMKLPRYAAPPALLAAALLLVGMLSLGCADSESSTQKCTVTGDCGEDQVCYEGACQHINEPRVCTTPSDCIGNESCVAGFRGVSDVVEDTYVPTDTNTTDTVTVDTHTTDTRPDALDTIPPTVVSFTPADGAVDVPVDTTITITFSEPMLSASITNGDNIYLTDINNRRVSSLIEWNATTLTATLTPQSPTQSDPPLWAWNKYTVNVTPNCTDLAQNSMVEVDWEFFTVAPASAAFHEELARAYAPIFHLDSDSSPRTDVPIRVDYDGNPNPTDNLNNIGTVTYIMDPAVYFDVTETETHYFVRYVLYFPGFQASSTAADQEHAVNGASVVVAKVTGQRLGQLAFVETYSAGWTDGRVDTFFPDCAGGATEPFCPTVFSGKAGSVMDRFHNIDSTIFSDSGDARRVRLYVNQWDHDICHFAYEETGAGYCGHSAESYNFDSAVLIPNTTGGAGTPVDWTAHTGTYGLYPLAIPWWTMRDAQGSSPTNFYLGDYLYTAPAATQPGASNDMRMPNALHTDDTSSNTGMYSPWAWTDDGGGFGIEKGVWFIDPAHATNTRLNVPAGFATTATRYCYSLYTGIDRTGTDAICQPAP